MIRVVQNGWFSRHFTVLDSGETPVGQIGPMREHSLRSVFSDWPVSIELEVGGRRYEAINTRGSVFGAKEFAIETEDGRVAAVAQSRNYSIVFDKDIIVFEHAGNRYELKKGVILSHEGTPRAVGSVRPKGIWKQEWRVELPEGLPLEVGVFIIACLMIIRWKRASGVPVGSAAAGAAAGPSCF